MPDFSTYNWNQLAPATSPSARWGHAMVWDGTRIIMFGGSNVLAYGTGDNAETWEYTGGNWNQLAPATSPPARRNHTMVWDGTNVILHGGSNTVTGFESLGLQDTWTFNGTTWTDVTPGGAKPTVRHRHLAAWDGTRMVIYGGQSGSITKKDTWKFEAGAWTQLTPTHYIVFTGHPSSPGFGQDGRAAMPAVWDGARILTFSGYSDPGGNGEFATANYQESGGGLWQYAAADWTQVGPATNPDARFGQALCVTDDDQKLLMYGGNVSYLGGLGYAFDSETWQYDGSDWLALFRSANPGVRTSAMVWDTVNARGLLFSGGTLGQSSPTGVLLNDTWEFAPPDTPGAVGVFMPATSIPIE